MVYYAEKDPQLGFIWKPYQHKLGPTGYIMALFEMSPHAITGIERVKFADLGVLERGDLQRLLRDYIEVISPDTMVISEEFSGWDRSERRIDLLGIDRQGRLVVIELKRTADDSFVDLQALRYAAMVSQLTFDEAVETEARIHAGRCWRSLGGAKLQTVASVRMFASSWPPPTSVLK